MAGPEQSFEDKVVLGVVKQEENWEDVQNTTDPVVVKEEHDIESSLCSDELPNQSIPIYQFGSDNSIIPSTEYWYPNDSTRQWASTKQTTTGPEERSIKAEFPDSNLQEPIPDMLNHQFYSDVDLAMYQKESAKHSHRSTRRSRKVRTKSSQPGQKKQNVKPRKKQNISESVKDRKVSIEQATVYCKAKRQTRKALARTTDHTALLGHSCIQTFKPNTVLNSKKYCSKFTQLRHREPNRQTRIGFHSRCKITMSKRCNLPLYRCVICEKKYSLYSKFVRHYSQEHLVKWTKSTSVSSERANEMMTRYKCLLCQRPFVHQSVLMQHLTTLHSGIFSDEQLNINLEIKPKRRRRSCAEDGCPFTCNDRRILLRHITKVHPHVMYKCRDCKSHYRLLEELKKHRKEFHSSPESTVAKNACCLCGKYLKKPYLLKMHMFTRHKVEVPNLKLFYCGVESCNYKTVSKQGLKQHMQKHQTDKPFSCDTCGKKLKTQRNLEKHISKMHLNIRPFMCEHCAMSFGEESDLKAHVLKHSNFKEFICEHCSYETHDKTTFKTHLYACHGVKMDDTLKVFNCNLCEFNTARKSHFISHMKVHMQIRDLPCPKCDKLFMTHNALHSHLQKVHRPKDYKCSYCIYAATNYSCLKQHIRVMHTHRDYKPFKCGYCEFHSAIRGNCRKHVLQRHRGQEVKVVYDGDDSMLD